MHSGHGIAHATHGLGVCVAGFLAVELGRRVGLVSRGDEQGQGHGQRPTGRDGLVDGVGVGTGQRDGRHITRLALCLRYGLESECERSAHRA